MKITLAQTKDAVVEVILKNPVRHKNPAQFLWDRTKPICVVGHVFNALGIQNAQPWVNAAMLDSQMDLLDHEFEHPASIYLAVLQESADNNATWADAHAEALRVVAVYS